VSVTARGCDCFCVCNTDAVAIGTRLMHGLGTQLTPWQLSRLTNPAWSKLYMDHPMDSTQDDRCFPPVLALTLPGVTKVPLSPKGGKGFSKKRQASSDLTVAYDDDFRVFITSTKDCQDKVRTAHGVGAGLPLPPTCSQEAYNKNQGGRPAAGGGNQARVYTRNTQPLKRSRE
jgi:hypothetical protein